MCIASLWSMLFSTPIKVYPYHRRWPDGIRSRACYAFAENCLSSWQNGERSRSVDWRTDLALVQMHNRHALVACVVEGEGGDEYIRGTKERLQESWEETVGSWVMLPLGAIYDGSRAQIHRFPVL